MGYIGKELTKGAFKLITLGASFNGSTTAFTMSEAAGNANNLLVILGGVLQHWGEAYTVSGTTITFSSAPATSTTIKILKLGDTYDMGQAGSLKPEAVSGLTNITTLADADEFLVHDATDNQLKAVVKSSMPGDVTLINSTTIGSEVSSVGFTSGIDDTYKTYKLAWHNMKFYEAGDDNYYFLFQFYIGGAYITANYNSIVEDLYYTGSASGVSTGTETSGILCTYGLSFGTEAANDGFLEFSNPTDTTFHKNVYGISAGTGNSGGTAHSRIGGHYDGTPAVVTGCRILAQPSASFGAGTVSLYGYK